MIKLDIGCGPHGSLWPGFTGVDAQPRQSEQGEPDFVQLDFLTDALPWAPGTVDTILLFHIVEHMRRDQGLELLKRAISILKPGGKLWVTTPDLRKLCSAYLNDDGMLLKQTPNGAYQWPGETLADRLNWALHPSRVNVSPYSRHIWIYDVESLTLLAKEAGATDIASADGSVYNKRPEHECGIVITKV